MSFVMRLEYTWYDAFKDPNDLAAVQGLLNAHQPPGVMLDWAALLAAESEGDYERFSNEEGYLAQVALRDLTTDPQAVLGERVYLVPVPFASALAVLTLEPRHPRWRFYPAERVVQQWEQRGPAYASEQERLRAQYDTLDRGGNWPQTPADFRIIQAHVEVTMVRLARGCLRDRVPASLID